MLPLITRHPRGFQPVEKVVVCPIGTTEEAQNKTETLRKRHFWPPYRVLKRVQGESFNKLCPSPKVDE